jgi:hypothetical protein
MLKIVPIPLQNHPKLTNSRTTRETSETNSREPLKKGKVREGEVREGEVKRDTRESKEEFVKNKPSLSREMGSNVRVKREKEKKSENGIYYFQHFNLTEFELQQLMRILDVYDIEVARQYVEYYDKLISKGKIFYRIFENA